MVALKTKNTLIVKSVQKTLPSQPWALIRYADGMNTPSPEDLLAQARNLRRQNKPREGLALAESALALGPETSLRLDLHFEIGSNALTLGKWQAAYEHLQACLVRDPAPAVLLHRLGRACQELGQLQEAREHYRQALAARSGVKSAKTWHQLGRVETLLGDSTAAIQAYQQAITEFLATEQTTEAGISAFQLGCLHQSQQQWEAAQQAFAQARKQLTAQADLRAEACYRLAEVAIQTESLDEAESTLSEALSIHRHLNQAAGIGLCLLKLCQVRMLQRRWKEVISTVRQAIEVLQTTREQRALQLAYELQAELLQLLGKDSEAKVWQELAQQLSDAGESESL